MYVMICLGRSSNVNLDVLKRLTFDNFDIHSIILNSAPLMASDNLEYCFQTGNYSNMFRKVLFKKFLSLNSVCISSCNFTTNENYKYIGK